MIEVIIASFMAVVAICFIVIAVVAVKLLATVDNIRIKIRDIAFNAEMSRMEKHKAMNDLADICEISVTTSACSCKCRGTRRCRSDG